MKLRAAASPAVPAQPIERSDEDLVAQVLDGDTAMFELLMRRHNERIYRAARAITRDDREAEDVMQQAYVNAFSNLRQFEGRAQFATWLTRIAVNEALARVRQRGRYEVLDDELSTMYDLVEGARGGLSLVASRRAAKLARRLYGLVADVTRLTERVENSLQVTEDVYLARIYGAALDQFGVQRLSAAVDRKLAIIRDTYGALYEEASSRRAELLELAIVLLIVFEILLALAE